MKLLLIHTGGTIGMADTPEGLAPRKGLVEEAISKRLPDGTELIADVFDPLLDSADVGPAHWNRMLETIRHYPEAAVIITHGTDTMAFTGAALSQALAGEARRVILCGSMLPLGQDGDAEGNLDLAISAAAIEASGVHLAFAGKLLAADGLVKHHSHEADAFRAQPQAIPGAPKHQHLRRPQTGDPDALAGYAGSGREGDAQHARWRSAPDLRRRDGDERYRTADGSDRSSEEWKAASGGEPV